jgi:anti-sigma B factor antagonist
MVAEDTRALLSASSHHQDGWSVVAAAGELDIATAPILRDRLLAAITAAEAPPNLIIDLSGVSFCDASGLRVLVGAHRQVHQRGGRLRVVCPEGPVLRILRITALTRLLPIHPTLAHALTDDTAPAQTAS